jgi:hypothetical protein
MTIEEAGDSLKLECFIRELGFIQYRWQVIANAGLYFVDPVSFMVACGPLDDSLGFQLIQEYDVYNCSGLRLGQPLLQTAKAALDLALSH